MAAICAALIKGGSCEISLVFFSSFFSQKWLWDRKTKDKEKEGTKGPRLTLFDDPPPPKCRYDDKRKVMRADESLAPLAREVYLFFFSPCHSTDDSAPVSYTKYKHVLIYKRRASL